MALVKVKAMPMNMCLKPQKKGNFEVVSNKAMLGKIMFCGTNKLSENSLNMKNKIMKENDIKKNNINKGNDLNKLIMSQDIIEGFWDENDNSLLIKKKINQKFVKIEDFVNAEKGIKDKKKVIFTILVIYYLLNDMKDKLDELRLIINKGKKYLNSIGYNYDLIIQIIGI